MSKVAVSQLLWLAHINHTHNCVMYKLKYWQMPIGYIRTTQKAYLFWVFIFLCIPEGKSYMGDTAKGSHEHLLSLMIRQEPITDYTPAKIYYSKAYGERSKRKMKCIHSPKSSGASFQFLPCQVAQALLSLTLNSRDMCELSCARKSPGIWSLYGALVRQEHFYSKNSYVH